MICNCKSLCKQAIVDWCKSRKKYIDGEFTQPLPDLEFTKALDTKNWSAWSESDPDFDASSGDSDYDECYNAWAFACDVEALDGLKAYVKVKDEIVVDILVIGE